MKPSVLALSLLAAPLFATAQPSPSSLLAPGMTLPVSFSKTIDANHAHPGDRIEARTTQPVQLADGSTLPTGSRVAGHIVNASSFRYDTTPYAKQPHSLLAIHFDSVASAGKSPRTLPLNVTLRALADPTSVEAAATPNLYDDTLRSRAQVGGDVVTPSQKEVVSQTDDVVGYLKHGDVYAHLLSASGNRSDGCTAGDIEVSMGVFSANACGLYGFTGAILASNGRNGEPSTFTLSSTRRAPEIWAHSAALLEVLAPSTSNNPASTLSGSSSSDTLSSR